MNVPGKTSGDWRVPVVVPNANDLKRAAEVPNAERIALTLFRDAVEEFPQNRGELERALAEKAPELPRSGRPERERQSDEPEDSMEAQREGAPERP